MPMVTVFANLVAVIAAYRYQRVVRQTETLNGVGDTSDFPVGRPHRRVVQGRIDL